MREKETTHSRVLQSLAESQIAKKNFLELKQKAELILAQLQQEEVRSSYPSESQYPLYATVRKDRKGKGGKVSLANPPRNTSVAESQISEEASPYQLRPRSLMLSYKVYAGPGALPDQGSDAGLQLLPDHLQSVDVQ